MPRFSGYPAEQRERRCPRAEGFTLLEVLIVIAIVVALCTIGFGAVRGARERAAIARTKAELALLADALEAFKRLYGDYPQAGASEPGSQRVTGRGALDGGSAQAILFNALTGVYGPRGPQAGTVNGPVFVELSKLTLEQPLDATVFDRAAGSSSAKPAVRNAFVDPWGNRYLYFYRRAEASHWHASTFLLYSAGPDGETTARPGATGVFSGDTQFAGDNADNLYAGASP